MKCISIVYSTKEINKLQKYTINSFFLKYNTRIIEEYFQLKIGGKITMSSLGRKKQHSYRKTVAFKTREWVNIEIGSGVSPKHVSRFLCVTLAELV